MLDLRPFILAHAQIALLSGAQEGNTALIISASSGRLDMVRLLLDRKADIQAASKVPPAG